MPNIPSKGYLKVSDNHQIYYEVYGKPNGIPVLYLHGGPGTGFSRKDRIYFNPKIYKVIFFDQRGSGKSRPFGSLKKNTTGKLINDIDMLLAHLKIGKVFLFGGSWGSTLALVYAISNPKRISGMLLRGIFLATRREKNYFERGGIKQFFPENWKRFISHVPKSQRKNPSSYYLKQMLSKNRAKSEKYAFEWFNYEASIYKTGISETELLKLKKRYNYRVLAPIECSYLSRNCYLPENYILKNIKAIKEIPVSIVQGRYDMVCPPLSAYMLNAKLKNSKLHVVAAGHASSERPVRRKLLSEMKRFERILF